MACVCLWVLRTQSVYLGGPRLQKGKAQPCFILCEIRSYPEYSPKPGKDVEVRADAIRMVVGAFTSPGEEEVTEPLCSPGKSLDLAGKVPCPGQGQAVGPGLQRNSPSVEREDARWYQTSTLPRNHPLPA